MICSRTAQKLLFKLRYEYKNVYKDLFINENERPDVVEDCNVFLEKIEQLKPYMVEFDKNKAMKPKVSTSNCAVGDNNWRPIIVITNDECTFFANNGIQKTGTRKSDIFLRPKDQRQGIMVFEFIFPHRRLNLVFFTLGKSEEVVQQTGLITTKAVKVFEYGKNNDRY